jgi:hypothetical protein
MKLLPDDPPGCGIPVSDALLAIALAGVIVVASAVTRLLRAAKAVVGHSNPSVTREKP